jgi:hypothetical protein
MNRVGTDCVVFRGEELLPAAWRGFAAAGPVRTFNPGLLRDSNGWIFAYRIVAHDGVRRIGMCRLDSELRVVADSQVAWSDHVSFPPDGVYPEGGTTWFADPRLYRIGQRLFIYWNSGWHEPRNCQFLQEFDPHSLLPRGHPRELLLDGPRQKLEKNWTFFAESGASVYAVYSIVPHRVLAGMLDGTGDICLRETASTQWALSGYPASHGGLRGGAPPVFADGHYWSFCHSVHDGPEGYRYLPAAYAFGAEPPFAPTRQPFRSLDFGSSLAGSREHAPLNPAVGAVIYPCGAARDGARWLISHGINDEFSAISIVEHSDVLAATAPVERQA